MTTTLAASTHNLLLSFFFQLCSILAGGRKEGHQFILFFKIPPCKRTFRFKRSPSKWPSVVTAHSLDSTFLSPACTHPTWITGWQHGENHNARSLSYSGPGLLCKGFVFLEAHDTIMQRQLEGEKRNVGELRELIRKWQCDVCPVVWGSATGAVSSQRKF